MSKYLNISLQKLIFKWSCQECALRSCYSQNAPKKLSYKHTILLPKTSFPERHSQEKRVAVEKDIQKKAQFNDIYKWQRENLKEPEYILHDGPPYANGDLHIGHSVNKIIKDISNRHHILKGRKVHYIPGWDCHGLPIELKALAAAKKDSNLEPLKIRSIARTFANSTSRKQLETFKGWGIIGDWENAYYTYDKKYVQNQLRRFYQLYEKGYIYRALKPVYWSPSTRTALAEAELEYNDKYKSTQVYAAFPLVQISEKLKLLSNGKQINALIWTTTPWTLPLNRAICFNISLKYCLVEIKQQLYIVCNECIEEIKKDVGANINVIGPIEASELSELKYVNPLFGDNSEELPMYNGDHVKASHSGLVHTAPAHGPDDFLVAKKHGLEVECYVDEKGCYKGLCEWLEGKYVLGEGQQEVLSRLGAHMLHSSDYIHSYPIDWRSGQPVILRASRQWFIRTDKIKDNALKCLQSVEILPTSSAARNRAGFESQVSRRPYWCISRQRCWGTPIPVLYADGNAIVHCEVIENLCQLIEEHGTDAWWKVDIEELLPKSLGLDPSSVTKGEDIMDIWMDSGVTWSYALDEASPADVYCEGVDQFTGWFQSSLLTSTALKDRAPYKSIFVHGFVVDENGRKMSKSLGNVIDPLNVIEGGKNKNKEPPYGVDTLRWWVASHATQHSQIIISSNLVKESFMEITRFRNTFKFLLGNIGSMKSEDFHTKYNLNLLDKYMLTELQKFTIENDKHYKEFRFNYVAKNVLNILSNQISSVYCNSVKDRLYCLTAFDDSRMSCQMVLHTILICLCRSLGPILPHLVEEVWSYHPLYKQEPFFKSQNIPVLSFENFDTNSVEKLFDVKRNLTKNNTKLEQLCVILKVDNDVYDKLVISERDLCDILQVSNVKIMPNGAKSDWEIEFRITDNAQCDRCRRFTVTDLNSELCSRCSEVINKLIN